MKLKSVIWTILTVVPFVGAEARWCRTITASGGAPIPVAYSISDAQSLISDQLQTSKIPKGYFKNLFVTGTLAADICFNTTEGNTTTVPTSVSNTQEQCTIAGQAFQSDTNIWTVDKRAYVRSKTGAALTAGWVQFCFHERMP